MSGLIPAMPTMSLGHGHAGHDMPTKLKAMAKAGFKGVEIFYMCLESFSLTLQGDTPRDKLREAARQTRQLCDELGLTVFVLQPVVNYDGIIDEKEHSERIEEVVFRFELCDILGCDILQVPANFRLDDGITGDEGKVVADLRELADLGLARSPPIRFVYEAMCWSTYNYTWQQAWHILQKVDRRNFGIVLDAFHLAGYEYADVTVEGCVRPKGMERLKASLEELVKTIPGDRVFYLQLVDAERISPPLAPLGSLEGSKSPYYLEGQHPYMSWSRNCRLFPYENEKGAFMPIEMVTKAFIETGFKGYVSFEYFNRDISETRPEIPTEHAERGWKSWKTLEKNLGL